MPPDAPEPPNPDESAATPGETPEENRVSDAPTTGTEAGVEAPRPKRAPREHWLGPRWWLPLALLFSVALHLILGYGAQQLGWFGVIYPETPRRDAIEVAIVPRRPVQPAPPSAGQSPLNEPPAPEDTPAPVPTPEAAFNNFIRPPVPTREVPVPTFQTPPIAVAPVVPTSPPVTIRPPTPVRPDAKRTAEATPDAATTDRTSRPETNPKTRPANTPAAAGPLADRLPEPLPPGELTGTPDTPRVARSEAGPRSTNGPMAAKRTGTEPAETGGADPGGVTKTTEAPGKAAAPGEGKNVADAGKGEGTASGNGRGNASPVLARLGIDRGIPFGSRLGLYNGNPNGGGGGGEGPGGGSDASITRRADGTVNVSMKRTATSSGGPPVRVVYVVDVSESMEDGDKIGKAREALRTALGELRPDDYFSVVSFGTTAEQRSKMAPANRRNLENAFTMIRLLKPIAASGTNFSEALALALKVPGATHVIVLSDGVPTVGETDPASLLRDAREWNTQNARFITMALIGPHDERKGFEFLRDLAEQNHGHFDYVDLK